MGKQQHAIENPFAGKSDFEAMLIGPTLASDGTTIVVSTRYFFHEGDSKRWLKAGCTWNAEMKLWICDTNQTYRGKVFTPNAWLTSLHRLYREIYAGALSAPSVAEHLATTPQQEVTIYKAAILHTRNTAHATL